MNDDEFTPNFNLKVLDEIIDKVNRNVFGYSYPECPTCNAPMIIMTRNVFGLSEEQINKMWKIGIWIVNADSSNSSIPSMSLNSEDEEC